MIAVVYLGLAIATFSIYSQVRDFEFVNWDDDSFVHQNQHVVSGLSIDSFWWSLGIHGPGQWHPMAWWAHQLNCQLFGIDPGAHHMANVALHVIVTLVLMSVLWRMTGDFWPSALVAALHALHPLSVESVAWISHLREPLSLLFWLLVMGSYCSYVRYGGVARYTVVVLLFALGLIAKPTLITLPFVLLLLDWWPLNRFRFRPGSHVPIADGEHLDPSLGKLVLEKIPLLALSLVSVCLAYLCQRSMDAVVSLESHSLAARLANVCQSYVLYLRNMVWPLNLTALYPLPDEFYMPQVVGSLVLLIAITVMAVYFRRQAPHCFVGWFWYLVTLVPVIGILKMGAMTAMTDHYMYVSLLGVYIAIVWQLAHWLEKNPHLKYFVGGSIAVILVALMSLSSRQIAVWKNSETLWKHALAVSSESSIAHNNLGEVLLQSNRVEHALEHYYEALRIDPDYVAANSNAGRALQVLGRSDEAISRYRTALDIEPHNAVVHYNYGIALHQQQRWADAIKHFEEALRIKPEFAAAHTRCGLSMRALGRTEEAIAHYRKAVKIDPSAIDAWNNLGVALKSQGRDAEALKHYEKVLSIDPSNFEANYNSGVVMLSRGRRPAALARFETATKANPESGGAHYGVAWILATAPEEELRDGSRAIQHARRATQLLQNNAFMLDALAAAHAEAGQFSEAVKWAEKAVQLASSGNQAALQSRLARYKQKLPYRLPK